MIYQPIVSTSIQILTLALASLSCVKLASATILLKPTDDVQAVIDQSPEGTSFVFSPGTYQRLQLRPKSGDSFSGAGSTTVLTGAVRLASHKQVGSLFASPYGGTAGQQNGICTTQASMCRYPEDLFFDNRPLQRVASIAQVAAGRWYLDYVNRRVYYADNPAGHVVEVSSARSAFGGRATGVRISSLTVEKYAVPAQMGAIGDQFPGANWTVAKCTVRLNHGAGIRLLDGGHIIGNLVTKNGQLGVGASGANIIVQGNEISYNNYAGFDPSWEAGGGKFTNTVGLVVRQNKAHDNKGPGLWTDIDNSNTLYDSNVVQNNAGEGIKHEISFAAIIENNTVSGNGNTANFLWGAQILVQNSSDVEVMNNRVTVGSFTGNGIGIINQNRGADPAGRSYNAQNNYFHDNDVTYLGQDGSSGIAVDFDPDQIFTASNRFDYNHYHVAQLNETCWQWRGWKTFSGFQDGGQEQHGSVDVRQE